MEKSHDLAAWGTDKPAAAAARTATFRIRDENLPDIGAPSHWTKPAQTEISRAGARSPGGLASRCTPFPHEVSDVDRVA